MENIVFNNKYSEPTHSYNIICVSVFKLKYSYRSSNVYHRGLRNIFMKFINGKVYINNCYLRIYYEHSLLNDKELWQPLFDEMSKHEKIQLIEYNCVGCKLHDGLIGTIIRYYPLFDYENNKNLNYVIVTDIDSDFTGKLAHAYNLMKKLNIDTMYGSRTCYTSINRFDLFDDIYDEYPLSIIGSELILKNRLPRRILDNFMECMYNLDNDKCIIIKKFIENERNSVYKKLEINDNTNFVYGIDELMLYKYILSYIVSKGDILVSIYSNITRLFYMWYLRNNNFSDKKLFESIIRKIMEDKYDDKKTHIENYAILDNILNSKNMDNKAEQIKYSNNIKNVILELYKNGTYGKYNLRSRDCKCLKFFNLEEESRYIIIRNGEYFTLDNKIIK